MAFKVWDLMVDALPTGGSPRAKKPGCMGNSKIPKPGCVPPTLPGVAEAESHQANLELLRQQLRAARRAGATD